VNEEPEGIVCGRDGCPRCAAVKEHLSGRRIECRPIEVVLTGQDPQCVDAMAQLAWQDYELPVVLLNGVFARSSTSL
jgi:glutaredoxin